MTLVLTNTTVITPDRVVAGGSVVIAGGVIADVLDRTYAREPCVWDLGGRYLLPGFVDLHNDGLEREIYPRLGGEVDPDYAMAQYDRRLAAAGVTTEYHGVNFVEHAVDEWRTLAFAARLAGAVRTLRRAPYATIDHRVLYRLELRTPGALDALLACRDEVDGEALVSVALHNRNIGHLRPLHLEALRACVPPRRAINGAVPAPAAPVTFAPDAEETTVVGTLARVTARREEHGFILASHDDDTLERVDMQADLGFRIAEFPMTVAAAERARWRGMRIVVGAPNALRGRSYQGAVSVRELVARGLADILVADYSAPALVGAVFQLAELGLATLPAAVAMATANPARAVGLHDRGMVAVGQRADLTVVRLHGTIPVVDATLVRGEQVTGRRYDCEETCR